MQPFSFSSIKLLWPMTVLYTLFILLQKCNNKQRKPIKLYNKSETKRNFITFHKKNRSTLLIFNRILLGWIPFDVFVILFALSVSIKMKNNYIVNCKIQPGIDVGTRVRCHVRVYWHWHWHCHWNQSNHMNFMEFPNSKLDQTIRNTEWRVNW